MNYRKYVFIIKVEFQFSHSRKLHMNQMTDLKRLNIFVDLSNHDQSLTLTPARADLTKVFV